MTMLKDLIERIIAHLSNVDESKNWKGNKNWQWLGANDRCWRCGGTVGEDIEPGSTVRHHIIPESEGGANTADNLSLLCGSCHNVVHGIHMGIIGAKRTRDEEWRTVGKIKGILRISQKLSDKEHKLSCCPQCGNTAKITGVSEGYWGRRGMAVFLDCGVCGHLFAIPFLALEIPPK